MDHQQNYEFNDPNAFGFISSFSGSENFLLAQPQQEQLINGKSHDNSSGLPTLTSMQNFDADTTESAFLGQPSSSIFHLSETAQSTIVPFSTSTINYHSLEPSEPNMNVTSQKVSLFNIESLSDAVPANLIQETAHSSIIDVKSPSHQTTEPLLSIVAPSHNKIDENTKDAYDPQLFSETHLGSESCEESLKVCLNSKQMSVMEVLEVARKKTPSLVSGLKKRRRRILREDDSDDESELKREMLLISPEKDNEKTKNDEETEDSSPDSDSDDLCSSNKVRSLLKSAIIIQGPVCKKKKKRVLESDDEYDLQTSVDDIGLINENENDIDDELCNGSIVVTDADFQIKEGTEKVIPFKRTFIQQDKLIVSSLTSLQKLHNEEILTLKEEKTMPSLTIVNSNEEVKKCMIPTELKRTLKTEKGEIDPSMSVEAILENIKPMADDDSFFQVGEKSDDSDVQFVSNEEYFGTPDLSKQQSHSRRSQPRSSRKRSRSDSGRRKRSNKYEKDFVEGSSESEDTAYSESSLSSSDSSIEEIRPRGKPILNKLPTIDRSKYFSVNRVPIKKQIVKKDRFYDRSRDIPNDVYFGDVKVPLHVLHTKWNSDVESSNSSEPENFSYSKPNHNRVCANSSTNNKLNFSTKMKPTFSYIEQIDDPKLSGLKDFAKITGIKINYARLFEGIKSTEDKCMLIRRILAQKGLQGEPTMTKCKQLRLDLQAKRESAELDKSLIIRAEGRTRRATRNVRTSKSPFSLQPSTSSAVVQPETLQTLSKIRRVVDSDSE